MDVDDAAFREFTGSPPQGKMRGANAEGYPAWVDLPPLTPEEARQDAAFKKRMLMDKTAQILASLQDAADLGVSTAAEKASLLAWKKYRVLLNRLDISSAPDIDWPNPPSEANG